MNSNEELYRRALNRIWKAVKDYRLIISEEERKAIRESQFLEYCEIAMKCDIMKIITEEARLIKERKERE